MGQGEVSDKYIVGHYRCEVSHNGTKGLLTLDSCLERKFGVSTAVKVAVLPSPDVPVQSNFRLLACETPVFSSGE